ncbi:hypothetical protein pb186bvf_005197 [Paramecium bursaria]
MKHRIILSIAQKKMKNIENLEIFFNSFLQNMSTKLFNFKESYYGAQHKAINFICQCSQYLFLIYKEAWYLARVMKTQSFHFLYNQIVYFLKHVLVS